MPRSPHDPQQLSASPTLPRPAPAAAAEFDVRDLFAGPAAAAEKPADAVSVPLDEKFRQAYFWIVNHAIITPYYDIEYHAAAPRTFRFGGVEVARPARAGGTRVRLSCVLVKEAIDSLDGIRCYLNFAASVGVDNVIFRQLRNADLAAFTLNHVVRFSDTHRVLLEPLLDAISTHRDFEFQKQIVGYYYYVEVWRHGSIDVVFEEADLARLEATKRAESGMIHELVFHPNGVLASSWQPWDDVLTRGAERRGAEAAQPVGRPGDARPVESHARAAPLAISIAACSSPPATGRRCQCEPSFRPTPVEPSSRSPWPWLRSWPRLPVPRTGPSSCAIRPTPATPPMKPWARPWASSPRSSSRTPC